MFAIGKYLSKITNFVSIIGGLAIALMMFHITADVAGRYIFDSPMPGTITVVSYYYMSIAAFIPLAFAEQKDAHISVEVITERMPRWMQHNLERLALLCSLTVFGFLGVRSFLEAQRKFSSGASIVQGNSEIPIWLTYFVLPLGCLLMVLVVAYKLISSFLPQETGLDTERAQADDIDQQD
ncbi:TRAP transporter small permease [Marinobacter lacisalsi]|uniref:TRAP transporter small permease protein n=1 Tax=Marinobacter lacisalsi TaxID=475979 RepID=A0ABV8QK03_9GAMM